VVLVVLGVLMVGLNGLAKEERRRTERRPVRQPLAAPPLPQPEPEPLVIEPPEPAPTIPPFDAEAEPDDQPTAGGRRRRRSGISPDALEELLDL